MRISQSQYKTIILKSGGSKYKNKKTFYNGNWYDSKKESEVAQGYDLALKCKAILSWERQIRYKFVVNGKNICTYVLDFKVTYPDHVEYIDVKPFDKKKQKYITTPTFNMKRRLMKALYDIDVILV